MLSPAACCLSPHPELSRRRLRNTDVLVLSCVLQLCRRYGCGAFAARDARERLSIVFHFGSNASANESNCIMPQKLRIGAASATTTATFTTTSSSSSSIRQTALTLQLAHSAFCVQRRARDAPGRQHIRHSQQQRVALVCAGRDVRLAVT